MIGCTMSPVRGAAIHNNGMSSFADVLSKEEVENIHHYVKARAHEDREVALGNMEAPQFTWFGAEE